MWSKNNYLGSYKYGFTSDMDDMAIVIIMQLMDFFKNGFFHHNYYCRRNINMDNQENDIGCYCLNQLKM